MTDELAAEPTVAAASSERSGRSWAKRLAIASLVIVGLIAVYYVITLVQVMRGGRLTQPHAGSADVIVVLGAAQYDGRPSPQLAARLDHAIELFDQGVAPLVMVTGGKQPADRFTEAEASAAYLVEHGVPEAAIVGEDRGRTTFESLDNAAVVLKADGFDRVVLVTDPFHSLRSKLIAGEVGLNASLSPTPTSVVTGWDEFRRELFEAGGVAVGRIIGFDNLSAVTG